MKTSHALKDIIEIIPEYHKLEKLDQEWLIKQYFLNYKRGLRSISQEIFTDEKNITSQDIFERINNFSEIKIFNTDFIRKLAKGDIDSLDMILDESADQDDFIYEVYEENFMDRIPHKIDIGKIPENLRKEKEKKYDIAILLQEAYSNGVISKLDNLAKEYIIQYARGMLRNKNK